MIEYTDIAPSKHVQVLPKKERLAFSSQSPIWPSLVRGCLSQGTLDQQTRKSAHSGIWVGCKLKEISRPCKKKRTRDSDEEAEEADAEDKEADVEEEKHDSDDRF